MSIPEGIAEIVFPPDQGWNLSSAGLTNPLRYWAHVHFEADSDWGKTLWTVFVEPEMSPTPQLNNYVAKIFFMAPGGPHHFIDAGNRFDLCVGNLVKATGVILRRLEN